MKLGFKKNCTLKGIFVIIDGMGDLPTRTLNNKTPLEAAKTPHMDFLATRGEMGYYYTVKPGFIPESDEAIVSIFGNKLMASTRGQLEARGAGMKLVRGDLALRANFATVDSYNSGNIIDRRAGRTLTTAEAESLGRAINKIKLDVPFEFKPTVQHRAAIVFRGGFSDNFSGNDATYFQGKTQNVLKTRRCKALDDDENTKYTIDLVNEFLKKVYNVLDSHPVNIDRKKRGLMPANYLFIRGAGIEKPKLKQYRGWASLGYMPLEIGFSKVSGMKVYGFDYPKLKGIDSYVNLWRGLKKACKFSIKIIKKSLKNHSYLYLHIKETDLPGHDNKPFVKKEMIEYIDKTLIKYLRKVAPYYGIKVVVTADHSTPCKLKVHSADPVPLLLYNNSVLKEKHFSEKEARKGTLGRIVGGEIFKKVGFGR